MTNKETLKEKARRIQIETAYEEEGLDNWEKEFWKIVEESGVGSDIRFCQKIRDFIRYLLKKK